MKEWDILQSQSLPEFSCVQNEAVEAHQDLRCKIPFPPDKSHLSTDATPHAMYIWRAQQHAADDFAFVATPGCLFCELEDACLGLANTRLVENCLPACTCPTLNSPNQEEPDGYACKKVTSTEFGACLAAKNQARLLPFCRGVACRRWEGTKQSSREWHSKPSRTRWFCADTHKSDQHPEHCEQVFCFSAQVSSLISMKRHHQSHRKIITLMPD